MAAQDARRPLDDVEYRIAALSGERFSFREDSLGMSRVIRRLRPDFEIRHPAGFLGELGAAAVPLMLGVALTAAKKGYAPGRVVLAHCGNDDGERAAVLLDN